MSAALALVEGGRELSTNALATCQRIFEAGGLKPAEAWLLATVAIRCGDRGPQWEAYCQLSDDTKISERNLTRLVLSLEERGLLVVIRGQDEGGRGAGGANMYAVDVGAVRRLKRAKKARHHVQGSAGTLSHHGQPPMDTTSIPPMDTTSNAKTLSKTQPKNEGEGAPARDPHSLGQKTEEKGDRAARCAAEAEVFAELGMAYRVAYGVEPVTSRKADRETAWTIYQRADRMTREHLIRLEARGETWPVIRHDDTPVTEANTLEAMRAECFGAWFDAYLDDKGSKSTAHPGGFLASRRHPLSCMMDDLEKYTAAPWAKKEADRATAERQAARAAELRAQNEERARMAAVATPDRRAEVEAMMRALANGEFRPAAPHKRPGRLVPAKAEQSAPNAAGDAPAVAPQAATVELGQEEAEAVETPANDTAPASTPQSKQALEGWVIEGRATIARGLPFLAPGARADLEAFEASHPYPAEANARHKPLRTRAMILAVEHEAQEAAPAAE